MTKKQRLSFYKELLRVVCENSSVEGGFCRYITSYMRNWYSDNGVELVWAYLDEEFKQNLPELYKMKPKITDLKWDGEVDYWFPCTKQGWQQRIDLLVSVINKMENR